MLQSKLFTKTRKEAPKDEVAKNAQLLVRGGFVHKEMAGVYSYLPLGLRVLRKLENIIREEMNKAGGVELLMPSLHPKENWEKTGRWDTMDDLYKLEDKSGKEMALGATHEEIIVPLLQKFISSYRDLPLYLYQIQNKFRMELRAKSGILRGREFLMKDLYSFHKDEKDMDNYYEKMKTHYKNIFNTAGIGEQTYITFASGGSFSKYSHEFQTVTDAGEDIIFLCEKCGIAVNKELVSTASSGGDSMSCPDCGNKDLVKKKAIEVGNIFPLKTKYSEAFDLKFIDENKEQKHIIMGCYGIGLGRLMGTIVEVHNDEKGIVWPESVAPFQAHLVEIKSGKAEVAGEAERLYTALQKSGIEVLYDDREDARAGEKFADSDLIGIPWRIVVSEKTVAGGEFELKNRKTGDVMMVSEEELVRELKN